MKRRLSAADGQGLIEFAMVLPIFLLLVLGVIEVSYALLNQHVVTKLTREGSNLISRDTTLQDAATAMRHMTSRPVDFSGTNSRMILSVIRRGATTGTANYNKDILYQRYQIGGLSSASRLATRGSATFGGAPDYTAYNADTNTNLQVTNLPATITLAPGGMLYVTEVYTRHSSITPLRGFGLSMPETLYSIAYF
jgi:Flp pilus assembly protein TadG